MSIDARLDVLERRILAQGKTPEEWAVEVAHPVEGVWTTMFYVGVQGFRLAFAGVDTQTEEAEEHCMFIGRMFVKALQSFVDAEAQKLWLVIREANNQLFDSSVDDPQHQVDCHADTLPAAFLRLAAGHAAAFETLQGPIREWLEPDARQVEEASSGIIRQPVHEERMLGLRGHCPQCGAKPGEPCRRPR